MNLSDDNEKLEQIYYAACREYPNIKGLRAVAEAAVQAEREGAVIPFPPAPQPIAMRGNLELFDLIQMHQYALRYSDAVLASVGESRHTADLEMAEAAKQIISEAKEIFDWPQTLQDVRDVIEWFAARLACQPQASSTVPGDADQYYLQESPGFVGNDMVFWRKNGAGYTTDLRDAHVYTLAEATRKQKSRKTDIPWSKSYIDSKARPAVDCQYVSKDDAELFAAASQPDAGKEGK